jgi:hypothetical protein
VDRLIVKFSPAVLGIEPQYASYKVQLGAETSVFGTVRKSDHTLALEEQDGSRDNIVRGFDFSVKSYAFHFDPAKQKAAQKLQALLDRYGNIAAKPIDQETAVIDDLLRELAAPDYAAALDVLAFNDWVVQLNAENQAFKDLMDVRYEETAQRAFSTKMKGARAGVDRDFRAVVDYVEAQVIVKGLAPYELFIHELNAILERYKNMLAQRQGRAKKSSTTNATAE